MNVRDVSHVTHDGLPKSQVQAETLSKQQEAILAFKKMKKIKV